MHQEDSKEVMLINSLKLLLTEQDLKQQQAFILNVSEQLGVSVIESAAALLYHNKVNISSEQKSEESCSEQKSKADILISPVKQKRVRYRLEIGRKHQVLPEEVKNTLVEISGVERNQIGRMDVRNHYTLVDLPYGMPADIFQLLSETEIRDQKLKIKRIKQQKRYNNQQKKNRK